MKRRVLWLSALALLANFPYFVKAQAPDLTTNNLALIDKSANYSLGPTGLRGWIYVNRTGSVGGMSRGEDGSMTDTQPYQVLVVTIGTNTPAVGVFQVNDVLLGVNTGSGKLPVPLFTNDTRRAIGAAIGAAEAGDGWMNFRIFRAGATKDVSIRLNIHGKACSTTAPYDCPKSALILSNAVAVLGAKNLTRAVDGLALLASGNTNYLPKIKTFARSIGSGGGGLPAWGWGYNGIFLSEYYLKTGDTNVLQVLSEIMKNCALTDRYGTMCHGPGAIPLDGSYNGVAGGYGPVNQVGLTVNLAMVMGKKCLLAAGRSVDPAVEAAITRGTNFVGWFMQKGPIPYGEHNPWGCASHADNGKHGQIAVLSALLGDQPEAAEYWTRMTLANYQAREYGHGGQGFSFLWGGIGANMGGAKAMAAYVANIQWHLDLSRRSDGSFTYDGAEQYGPSSATDYWTSASHFGFADPTAYYILAYATPLKQIYLTGRDLPASNMLSADKVSNAIWSATGFTNVTLMTTSQLVDALDEFDPAVRLWAARELGKRPGVEMASITNLLGSTNAWLRASACAALGVLKDTNSLPALGQCLSDPDVSVRAYAGLALKKFNHLAAPLIPTMLKAYAKNAHDPYGIDWEDPWECANGILAEVLFGGWIMTMTQGHDALVPHTAAADRKLLYPVMRLALKHPDSLPRGAAAGFARGCFTFDDIKALTPDLIECATTSVLADPMWRSGGRESSIRALGKFHSPEAVPVALAMQHPWWWAAATGDCGEGGSPSAALEVLASYGDSVRWVLPTLEHLYTLRGPQPPLVNAINAIKAATRSPVLTNLFPVARSQAVAVTNTVAITLTGFSCRTPAVTFVNVSKPAHGRLAGTPPNLTYTPARGYSGVDRFTFQVADQLTNSAPATVSIIVGTAGTGIQGQYYDTLEFTSQKVTRVDSQINFDWGNSAPTNTMGSDTFSVQWSGQLLVPETGAYTFSLLNTDRARLYVNGQCMVDDGTDHDRDWKESAPIELTAGQQAQVWLEYCHNTGEAAVKLKWSGPSFAGSNGVIIGTEWLGAKLQGSAGTPGGGLWRRLSEWLGTSSAPQANVSAIVTNTHVYAFSQSVSTVQNTDTLVILSSTHTNFIFSTLPKHGRLSGTAPRVTYTPEANYTGTDSFTFRVTEGVTTSAVATVSITVLYGNPVSYSWTSPGGVWSAAGNWANAPKTAAAPAAAGSPNYTLNFHRAGTCSVTNDLSTDFLLNKLSLKSALTVNGNSICTANNGPLLPEINQESGNAVTFNAPLTLGATTTLGGNLGGPVTVNGRISGKGGLIINSPGNFVIGNTNNTYSGGTIINNGAVSCSFGGGRSIFGTGPITFNPSARFFCNRHYLTNSITLNGTTLIGGNSFSTDLVGPVTLQGITTIDGSGSGNLGISGNISGSGGLITKPGYLSLSGTNTYTGSTTVENGSLHYGKADAVAPGALIIIGSSKVSLNYTGDRKIASLTLGGVVQPDGTYGSTASPATFKNDTYFAGKGTVTSGKAAETQTAKGYNH